MLSGRSRLVPRRIDEESPMRDLEELELTESQPPPSPELFERLETAIGHRLPSAYRLLLLHANGGQPGTGADTFAPLGDSSERWRVNDFYPLIDDDQDTWGLLGGYRMLRGTLPEKCLPIARDAGDSEICLDFRDDPPSVKLFDYEFNYHEMFVAPTFEAFLDLLSPSRA
jgi:hypothetical protein